MLHPPPRQFAPAPVTPTGLSFAPLIAVERDLAAAEDVWRAFERDNPGRLFQRFDWVAAWLATQGEARGVEPAIVILHDRAGAPAALFPFGVRRWRQVRLIEWLGAEHASFNLPLLGKGGIGWRSPTEAREFLRVVGRAVGDIDALALVSQPLTWDGAPHPFAGAAELVLHDGAYERRLPQGADPLRAILDRDARKKLRAKERRLAELGAVAMRRAQEPGEIAQALAAFLSQRRRRFAEAHIANPFDAAGAGDFLARATAARHDRPPAISLYCLAVGERIAAIFGGPEDAARFSGMFTSFDDAPEIARNSPGDILLAHMIEDMAARGVEAIDLGVGEARYKRAYCDDRIPMFETHLALTSAGALLSAALRAKAVAKRAVKRRPALLSLARRWM